MRLIVILELAIQRNLQISINELTNMGHLITLYTVSIKEANASTKIVTITK